MLPNELLATTKWKNNIKPKFANINADTISTTEKIINVYKKSIGQKQKKIREELSEIETLTNQQVQAVMRSQLG